MSEGEAGKRAILVLGMHRSGTSALTRVLGHLGCALPNDGIAAHPDNPKGYWEPQRLVAQSDRVLRTARTSWFDPRPLDLDGLSPDVRADHRAAFAAAIEASFGGAPLIAVKDPRLSRLVPLFVEAAADLGYATRAVLMLRSPAEIVQSLARRDLSTPAYAHALWLRHMIDAERDSRDLPRAILSFEDLLADWRAAIGTLLPLLDLEAVALERAAAIDAHLDRELRHPVAQAAAPAFAADLFAEAEQALLALRECDDAAARARIDAVAARFDDDPRLLDDIIHDELRHRRFRNLAANMPAAAPEPEIEPEPEPEVLSKEAEPDPVPLSLPSQEPEVRDIEYYWGVLNGSGLFDRDWYLSRYPDVAEHGIDPIMHYLAIGAREGRDPNPLFQTAYYARQMIRRDALKAGGA